MCGRYTAAKDFTELIKLVGVIMSRVPFFAPRYNIAPTQLAPVIYHERHQPAMKLMRWGLIPSWAKDESVGNAHINARSETLPSRNAFREAFKHRRCLIPADSFFEWQEREGKRQPFRVMNAGLAWNTANLTNGLLSVVQTTPTNLTWSVTGTNLNFSWPPGYTGWRLFMQTNNLGSGLSLDTNDWGTVPGSQQANQVVLPIDPALPAGFYRLIFP
jgi:SOS response associated peptidase (SRAP)